jgi:hypothetical protein
VIKEIYVISVISPFCAAIDNEVFSLLIFVIERVNLFGGAEMFFSYVLWKRQIIFHYIEIIENLFFQILDLDGEIMLAIV